MVNSTNEALTDRSGLCGILFSIAGPELAAACDALEPCRTGEACSTVAGNLPCKRVVHTVGPRYNERYRTAAENALHGCYRNSLRVLKVSVSTPPRRAAARAAGCPSPPRPPTTTILTRGPRSQEDGLKSIAFPCVYTPVKGYPREDAAHIAIRTVRRFLEMFGDDIDLVVLCVDSAADYRIYQKVMPLYLPRTPEEEHAARSLLPKDTGNEIGETVIADRTIRIGALPGLPKATTVAPRGGHDDSALPNPAAVSPVLAPQTHLDEVRAAMAAGGGSSGRGSGSGGGAGGAGASAGPEALTLATAEMARDFEFASMRLDPDEERFDADGASGAAGRVLTSERGDAWDDRDPTAEYYALCAEAVDEDLSDVAALNLVYQSGEDAEGRPIIVFMAPNIPATRVDTVRVLKYLFAVLDDVVERPFVLLYVHSAISKSNTPGYPWLLKVHNMLPRPWRKNLQKLVVLHPAFWLKAALLFMRPKLSKKFWAKVTYCDQVRQLYKVFGVAEHDAVLLPEAVYRVDQAKNAAEYRAATGARAAAVAKRAAQPGGAGETARRKGDSGL